MIFKFLIKNDEQEFKDQYYQHKVEEEVLPLFNFSYYEIYENQLYKHYLLFGLDKNQLKSYNNTLYRISNKFGDYIYEENNCIFACRYCMHIKENYYLHYYSSNFGIKYDTSCRVIFMDNKKLLYDENKLDWDTLTCKKINGLLPIEASLEINEKLPLFIDIINCRKVLLKL